MDAAGHLDPLETGQEDHRQEPRLPVDEPASLLVVFKGLQLACRVVEISLTGCRMLLGEPFAHGNPVRVEAAFKLRGVAFRLGAETEWSDGCGHLGVRFTELTPRRMDELIEVLCEVAAENAAQAVRRAAERRAAEESQAAHGGGRKNGSAAAVGPASAPTSATEGSGWSKAAQSQGNSTSSDSAANRVINEGGKLPPSAVAPPAPLRSANSGYSVQQGRTEALARPAGAERRSEARLAIETSAIILLVNVGSRIRGRILNLSLGGCRIRTEERFPVGIYTRVETEFRLEGLPFRLGGVVQAIQERNCVGIRFLDMSDRKRQQVEQLIGELADLRAEE